MRAEDPEPAPPSAAPIPESGRSEALAWLVFFGSASALRFRDLEEDRAPVKPLSSGLYLWEKLCDAQASMTAHDVEPLLEHGTMPMLAGVREPKERFMQKSENRMHEGED